jgi:hypothetical protein
MSEQENFPEIQFNDRDQFNKFITALKSNGKSLNEIKKDWGIANISHSDMILKFNTPKDARETELGIYWFNIRSKYFTMNIPV